jgi:ribulose 1,5-bisphosphate synthetase/thiazole synthase
MAGTATPVRYSTSANANRTPTMRTQVIIIGSGPAGLLLGALLAQAGVTR